MEKTLFKPLLEQVNAQNLIRLYGAAGYDLRFVGGCVRDCLNGASIGDVDMATPATPEQGQELLKAAGIKTIPTGIEHGTITAVMDGQPFEITTLRRDVTTDGRRATVAYTDSWQEDAARRDFTINAMSLGGDGALYDPFGGRADLKAGCVRFIGDAAQRIKEDALRILRFYRFNAHIGGGEIDADGLNACVEHAALLEGLSKERIRAEVFKLLSGKNVLSIWKAVISNGSQEYFLKKSYHIKCLEKILHVKHEGKPMLLSLFSPSDRDAEMLQNMLKLSNKETRQIADTLTAYADDWSNLSATLYHHGVKPVSDATLLRYGDGVIGREVMEAVLVKAETWQQPVFPVTGADLIKAGYTQGKEMGDALKRLEQYWVENGFKPSREECLARLSFLNAD